MRPSSHRPPQSRAGGFTLIELLTSIALLAIIGLILVGMASQAARMWSLAESQNQHRQRARAMLDFMAAEMREAVLPVDASATNSLQFILNPTGLDAKFFNRDAIFWQAPLASDTSRGDLSEVGYFVRWNGIEASLCRFHADPSDTNYLIYSDPSAWLSDGILDAAAPASKAEKYRGLFLENVIGLWVNAFNADGSAYPGDSRTAQALPARVHISLVLLDASAARRVTSATEIRDLYVGAASAEALLDALPAKLKSGASVVSTIVNLGRSR